MGISLGNVSIREFIKRTGYDISQEDISILEKHRQDNATIEPDSDKFHIFDLPFTIAVGKAFSKELTKLLMKYEYISPSKETLRIAVSTESEKETTARMKKEAEQSEWQEKVQNPNSIWNVKWHMTVPVVVCGNHGYYCCFINTYTKGRDNIPDIIDGEATIRLDEEGFHGNFKLYNPETDNDANEQEDWKYVIGTGFMSKSGRWIGSIDDAYFEETTFSIKDAIENRLENGDYSKEIHFHKIKE